MLKKGGRTKGRRPKTASTSPSPSSSRSKKGWGIQYIASAYRRSPPIEARSILRRSRAKNERKPKVPELTGPEGAEIQVNCAVSKRYAPEDVILGEGAGGTVIGVCGSAEEGGCALAKKIARVRTKTLKVDLDSVARDAYFLKRLANVRVDGLPVVPRLVDAWYCKRKVEKKTIHDASTVLERFDMNMAKVGERRALDEGVIEKPGSDIGLYNRSELLRMYRIAVKLGMLGIVWSDLKFDQFLYRTSDGLIVAIDFGFAGTIDKYPFEAEMGWPSNKETKPYFGVCPYRGIEASSTEEAILYNVWQLQAYLVAAGPDIPTYIRRDASDKRPKIFIGVKDFFSRRGASAIADEVCPGFLRVYEDVIAHWMEHSSVASFTWAEVSSRL